MNGFLLETGTGYPDKLHGLHNDYPLAPRKPKTDYSILSRYCSDISNQYGIKVGDVNKLVSNLDNNSNYVLHYRNLQLYLLLGMNLIVVHRILKFEQSDWLKKYIDFNTSKRKNTVNSFEKTIFKLMNNSVCGKSMENLRKQLKVRLINNAKNYFKKWVSSPSFVPQKIFSRHFAAIQEVKPVLQLDKPICVDLAFWI